MNIKLKKSSLWIIGLFVIMALSINCFYLVDSSILGVPCVHLAFFISLCYMLMAFLKTGKAFFCRESMYAWGGVILAFIGSFTAYFTYGQPFLTTLLIQLRIFMYTLIIVPIVALIKKRVIRVDDLVKLVYVFGVIYAFICTLQLFMSEKVIFLNALKSSRYGGLRLYLDTAYFALTVAIAFWKLLDGKHKFFNAFLIAWILTINIMMIKGRAVFTALIIAAVISVLVVKQVSWKKLMIIILLAVGVNYFLKNTEMGINIVNSIMNEDTSLSIRSAARLFYIDKFLNAPIWGNGYVDSYYQTSYTLSGQSMGYFYVDNGIWGIAFYYGTLGILWCVLFILPNLRDGIWYARNKNNLFALYYLIFILSICNNYQFDFFRSRLTFTLFYTIFIGIRMEDKL